MRYANHDLQTIEKTLVGIEEKIKVSPRLKKALKILEEGLPYDELLEFEISIAQVYLSLRSSYHLATNF